MQGSVNWGALSSGELCLPRRNPQAPKLHTRVFGRLQEKQHAPEQQSPLTLCHFNNRHP